MSDDKKYSEADVHRFFAIQYHGKTWELLDKPERTAVENECLADYAHTSLAHWRVAGTAVHYQRGAWLLSRVYAVLGEHELALWYARRVLELTEEHQAELEKFDFAFAYECIARAHALSGNVVEGAAIPKIRTAGRGRDRGKGRPGDILQGTERRRLERCEGLTTKKKKRRQFIHPAVSLFNLELVSKTPTL